MSATRTLGGMELLGEISAGGMGSVLLARKTGAHGFEKIVAVKTIRAELADREDIRRLFLDEARLAARIEHPAVTQVYEFGEDAGTLFLAMEYIHGVSLEALLEKLGAIPAGVAARICAVVCRGLHAAHETTGQDGKLLGVVHRDVSPPNVMITFDGGVKILDFGIALMRDRRAPDTHVGRLRGKLAYMAPEQMSGGRVDRRTDIYGVANVLFEITTGRKLLGDLQLHEVAEVLERPLPRAKELGVPAVLDEIIARGLARDPDARFADARAMAIALDAAAGELGGESLEEFAARTLAAEQSASRKQLAELTGAVVPAKKKSRGPTLVDHESAPPAIAVAPERNPEETSRVSRRSKTAMAAGAAIAVLVVAALSMVPRSDDPPATVADADPRPAAEARAPVQTPVNETPAATPPPSSNETARRERSRDRSPQARKREPAADREPARERGLLTVGAHPYAVVLLDGRELGVTPLIEISVPAGSHRIVLLDPATRAERLSDTIEIRANNLTNRLYR